MSNTRTKRAKRERQIADAALEKEIQKNEQKLPEILDDEKIFSVGDQVDGKKKKVFVQPARDIKKIKPKTSEVSYTDIWGGADASAAASKAKPKKKVALIKAPTSADSYRSETNVNPNPPKQEEETEETNAQTTYTIENTDTGIGDSLAGESPVEPEITEGLMAPAPPGKEDSSEYWIRNNVVPRHLPEDKKAELRKLIRENMEIVRSKKEEEATKIFEDDLARVDEYNHPPPPKEPKPKEDSGPNPAYIPVTPELTITEVPQTLGDIEGDKHPLSRIVQHLEETRQVGLRD